jgi:hypothetical protein
VRMERVVEALEARYGAHTATPATSAEKTAERRG